jgi:hypothetical protein
MIALHQIITQIIPRCNSDDFQQFYQPKMVSGFKFEPLDWMNYQLLFLVPLSNQGLEK